jgi:hypothetical protein
VSFVELLVAVVLLGTAVVAILTAVRATVIASHADVERAKASGLLQAAADAVEGVTRVPCAVRNGAAPDDVPAGWTDNRAVVQSAYADAVDAVSTTDWPGVVLAIEAVEYLGAAGTAYEWSSSSCYEGVQLIDGVAEDFRLSPLPSQKVTIKVTSADGTVVETIHVVKGELWDEP